MDTVALELSVAKEKLEKLKLKYNITLTKPTRNLSKLQSNYYVVRQQIDDEGVYQLIVAAKMQKEMCNNGL